MLPYVLGHMENEWFKIHYHFYKKILFAVTRNLAKLPCTLSANYFSLILLLLALVEYFFLCFLVFCFPFFITWNKQNESFKVTNKI